MTRIRLSKVLGTRPKPFAQEILDWIDEHIGEDTSGVKLHEVDAIEAIAGGFEWGAFEIEFQDPDMALLFKLRFQGFENGS